MPTPTSGSDWLRVPPAARVLRGALPDATQQQLLRVLHGSGAVAREAWERWRRDVGDPIAALRDGTRETTRALLPFLHHAVSRSELPTDPELTTLLRAATLREELRAQRGFEIAAELLAALSAAGIEVVVTGGWALAAHVHPRPEARHSGALRLVVGGRELSRAGDVARATGFAPRAWYEDAPPGRLRFEHESGLGLVVGTSTVEPPFRPPASELDAAGGATARFGGVEARVPAISRLLVQTLCRAAVEGPREKLLWAVDAPLLVDRIGTAAESGFRGDVRAARATLVACALLDSLEIDLGVRVPDALLEGLRDDARHAGRDDLELAITCARRHGVDVPALLAAADGAALRARIVSVVAMPSADYLRRSRGVEGWRSLARYHAARPARAAQRWLSP